MKKIPGLLAATTVIASLALPGHPQAADHGFTSSHGEEPAVRAAVVIAPPYVMQTGGSLTGFNIELWNAVAAQLNLKSSYEVMADVSALDEAMRSKKADISVAPLFITLARDAAFDFSYPTMQSGLQILVRDTARSSWSQSPLGDLLRLLFSWTTLIWLGMALLMVLVPAHLVWLFERRYEGGIVKNRSYFPGVFEAVYWAMSTLTAQAESMPRQWVGRAFSIFWMFAGVVFVAFYTAQLTTVLTVEQIRGKIEGPRDLPGKQVGTIKGSTAVDYLREHDAHVEEFERGDQMLQALLNKEVEAVVTGAPVLRYYAEHEGKGKVRVVGPEFDAAPIAIMFRLDSPLRRKVDSALLALHENGTYQQLYRQWFGSP